MKNIRKSYRKARAELNLLTVGTDEYNEKVKEVRGLNKIIRDHRDELKPTRGVYDKMTAGLKGFIGVAAAAFTADAIIQYTGKLFKLGAEMEVLTAKAKTVFGDALPAVTEAAEENANAMGLTASQYTDAAAAIGDLLVPMGFAREEAGSISTELVNLSGALSEWTGGQIEATEVADILGKAILGEREQLKTLGISINEADINARLAEKGLKGLTGEMLQQAKAAVTLELVTEKSADAQAAFAANSDTLVRKQAELRAQLVEIQEIIATALVPVFSRLLSAAKPFVSLIGDFVDIPLSQTLQQEQKDLSLLVARITEANLSQEDRNTLISELQSKYPSFLGNLDAEKVTNEQLANRLQKVNDQYIFKIALQKEDEKIQKAAERLANRQRSLAEKDVEIQSKLIDLNQEYNLGVDFTNKTLAERTEAIQNALRAQADQAENDIAYSIIAREIASLEISGRKVIEDRVNKRQEELNTLQQTREELKKNLAAELGIQLDQPEAPQQSTTGEQNTTSTVFQRITETSVDASSVEESTDKAAEALESLKQKVQDLRTEFTTGLLPEEEQAIAAIEQRYDAELAKAIELSQSNNQTVADAALQQIIELENLKEQAIAAEREKQFEARLERDMEQAQILLDEETKRFEEAQAVQAELDAFLTEKQLSEREQEIQELREHYMTLAAVAEEYGISTADITERYNQKVADINKEYAEKQKKEDDEQFRNKAQAASDAFGELSNAVTGFQKLAEQGGKRYAVIAKGLALVNIAAKSAEAIASGVAASAGVPFPANIAAIASTVATVLANIATAKSILNDAPSVPQRRTGGFFDVVGNQDSQNYSAQYIGRPSTGMLPGSPSLVLASERGPEYFVANEDLRNPVVLDYVRAIENIRRARLGQFRDGGATSDLPGAAGASQGPKSQEAMMLVATLERLNKTLDRGIPALLADQTLVDLQERIRELSAISGGAL